MDLGQLILRKHQKDFTGKRTFRKSVINDYLSQMLKSNKLTQEEHTSLDEMNQSPDKESRYLVQQIIYKKLYGRN
jgi:hypothetical protein